MVEHNASAGRAAAHRNFPRAIDRTIGQQGEYLGRRPGNVTGHGDIARIRSRARCGDSHIVGGQSVLQTGHIDHPSCGRGRECIGCQGCIGIGSGRNRDVIRVQ